MSPEITAPTWALFVEGWPIFRDPLLCALIAGSVLGFLSVYVVLKRMVFVSAAVTQASALGVALTFLAQILLDTHLEPVLGAAILSLVVTVLLMVDPGRLRLTRESVLGFAYAVAGGAAVLVGSRISQEAHDIQSILFGTAVMVHPMDLWLLGIVGGLTFVLQLWWFRGLTFAAFDPVGAHVQGLPTRVLDGVLLVSIGLMVGVSAHALGALPVFAFSTLPAVGALLLNLPLPWTFAVATIGGAVAGVGGYLMAFFREDSVGGSQTVLAGALVAVALMVRLLLHLVRGRSA
ncbi:MAG: metal ABC transporter permease [Myxococcaceae bacterium]|nr:metal ABC transporter permease [Myxococcaceae bacterium]MCI0671806.1 metal ABC transporter permease [Myxococcaceae bacterium]